MKSKRTITNMTRLMTDTITDLLTTRHPQACVGKPHLEVVAILYLLQNEDYNREYESELSR